MGVSGAIAATLANARGREKPRLLRVSNVAHFSGHDCQTFG
jgi:hypothetical protein